MNDDNGADRKIGFFWEKQFAAMAANNGYAYTLHQSIKDDRAATAHEKNAGVWNTIILPDVTLWTLPAEHHEIKHKDPSADGCIGLEKYRFNSLIRFAALSQTSVFYTIHNYNLQPDATRELRKASQINVLDHWISCDVISLAKSIEKTRIGPSWISGTIQQTEICYWNVKQFPPLELPNPRAEWIAQYEAEELKHWGQNAG